MSQSIVAVAEFQVSGMSCSHCERAIEAELGQLAGIRRIEVSASSGRLVVTSDQPIADELVLSAVDEAGYEAVRVR